MNTLKESLATKGIDLALHYLDKDFEGNLPKLLDWVDRFDLQGNIKRERKAIRGVVLDPENNWNHYLLRVWEQVDREVLKKFFTNFIVSSTITGNGKRRELMKLYECNIPWAILMDPTSACNLNCVGCWAKEYGNQLNLSFDTLDRIINEGKALGTFMYIFSGGEPLVRKKDIIRLCEKHHDCQFLAFTNGTLIDEAFVSEMLRVKNFIPAISIEGFEKETDARRGAGTFQQIQRAMDLLRTHHLPFGASCCYTRNNTEIIGSEDFFQYLVDQGCLFAWFFTYIPVGVDAVPELMVTAEQREFMYHQVRKFRESQPIFTMDFWNDGEPVKGCIAGGKCYLHINANGDIEPCAFIHYSDTNIHEHTLLEAYKAPLFTEYHDGQPFSENYLRPCPLLDHPEKLREMVLRSGAHSTDCRVPENVESLCEKCSKQAAEWGTVADRLWVQSKSEKV